MDNNGDHQDATNQFTDRIQPYEPSDTVHVTIPNYDGNLRGPFSSAALDAETSSAKSSDNYVEATTRYNSQLGPHLTKIFRRTTLIPETLE